MLVIRLAFLVAFASVMIVAEFDRLCETYAFDITERFLVHSKSFNILEPDLLVLTSDTSFYIYNLTTREEIFRLKTTGFLFISLFFFADEILISKKRTSKIPLDGLDERNQ